MKALKYLSLQGLGFSDNLEQKDFSIIPWKYAGYCILYCSLLKNYASYSYLYSHIWQQEFGYAESQHARIKIFTELPPSADSVNKLQYPWVCVCFPPPYTF